ncbi:MAG: aldehyde dehydrogenase (NADP(+)) [Bacteroidota bacterium]
MITENLIAGTKSAEGTAFLQSINPATQTPLPEEFSIATTAEVNAAVTAAYEAWNIYKNTTGKERAVFLRAIVSEIEHLGDTLIHRAIAESGLPENRIRGERGRTCNQLQLFANLIEEGSWVDAVIDEAMPDRKPLPRADIRKMSIAIGPVVVLTASNFPLAFSTAGGDTASALAAGCPVVVKAHPSHLGTNALVAEAIATAAHKCNMPMGVFSSLQGGIETGQQLVRHPLVKAVGFTGSYRGGKALFDLANSRPEPIPVYAEMGSNNPIFILEEKLKTDYEDLAITIANSVNLGAGQFCTNPGILVLQKSEAVTAFLQALESTFAQLPSAIMLNEGIFNAYNKGKEACVTSTGVAVVSERKNVKGDWKGEPAVASVAAKHFLQHKNLQEEVFGPFTLAVLCDDAKEVMEVAMKLQGQLTATIIATAEELENSTALVEILSQKAGRVIFNGVPTGVEVCPAMHHGGPFPSTSNALFTSVGTDAIKRFVRPVTFQNMPDAVLPSALKAANPLHIWRTVNGEKTKR